MSGKGSAPRPFSVSMDDFDDNWDRIFGRPKVYYCTECKQECGVIEDDEGIGGYEYWGAKGYDSRIELRSACCDTDVTEDMPEEDAEDD